MPATCLPLCQHSGRQVADVAPNPHHKLLHLQTVLHLAVILWWQGDLLMRDLLQQTLAALASVHASNVSHRDIKPENLLLSQHLAHAGDPHQLAQ